MTHKTLFLTLFSLGLALMSSLPLASQATESVQLERDEVVLHGSLHEADNSRVLVILHAGSGPTDRNGNGPGMSNNALGMLAENLVGAGFSVLNYDKRGIGESVSSQPEAELRPGHYVEDLVAWVDWAGIHHPDRHVVLMGHSEGGLFAKAAATARPDQVAAVVTLAAAGRPAAELLIEQTRGRLAHLEQDFANILERLLAGETVDDVPPLLNALFRPSVQPYLIDWLAMQPTALAAGLSQPLLVVGGSTDLQVTRADFEALAAKAQDSAWIEGMNHVLKASDGPIGEQMASYISPDVPLHPNLVPVLTEFLAAVGRGSD